MAYPLRLKACACCGTQHPQRARKCRSCGVPQRYWRALTSAEVAVEIARITAVRETFDRLVAERAERERAEIAAHWREDDC